MPKPLPKPRIVIKHYSQYAHDSGILDEGWLVFDTYRTKALGVFLKKRNAEAFRLAKELELFIPPNSKIIIDDLIDRGLFVTVGDVIGAATRALQEKLADEGYLPLLGNGNLP